MYTVTIPIVRTEQGDKLFAKRFALMNKCHNIIVSHAMHLLNWLKHNAEYQGWLSEYKAILKSKELSKEQNARKQQLSALMANKRIDVGLTSYGLEKYIQTWRRPYARHLSSYQVQKEAVRVWKGVEKVLFGNGKRLHFRRLSDCHTISTKDPKNGICLDIKTMSFRWIDKNTTYKCVDVQKRMRTSQKHYSMRRMVLHGSFPTAKSSGRCSRTAGTTILLPTSRRGHRRQQKTAKQQARRS